MSQSLWIDPGEMRASASELDRLAHETAQLVAELKATLAHEGECWGTDEPGKTFAKTYVPAEKQGMEGFENLVAEVQALGADVRNLTDTFENLDREGGAQVRNANPTIADATSADPMGSAYPTSSPTPTYPNHIAQSPRQPTGSSRAPDNSTAGNTNSRPPGAMASPATDPSRQPAVQQQPAAQQQPDSADSGSPGNGSDTDPSGDGQQPAVSTPGTSAPTASPAGGPARSSTTPANSGTVARTASDRPATAPPWARSSAGTASPSTPETANAPENHTPPRVSPPRPPNPAKRDQDKHRTTPPRREPAAMRPRPDTDDEAMRILREMAARHDLELTGFETAGIAEQTAQDIADAVDAVLGKYSIILCGIEIAAAGPQVRVENRSEAAASGSAAGTSQPPEPWIVLTRAAAADPGLLIERDSVATQSTVDTMLRHRPMYATMLLELGHVLDLTAGLRARSETQRALITEYLRISGAQADNLGRIVSDYKRWRAQLGDYCFDNRMLVPGRALAAGFAAVELHGSRARGPAKVLHRLLVVMARAALSDRR